MRILGFAASLVLLLLGAARADPTPKKVKTADFGEVTLDTRWSAEDDGSLVFSGKGGAARLYFTPIGGTASGSQCGWAIAQHKRDGSTLVDSPAVAPAFWPAVRSGSGVIHGCAPVKHGLVVDVAMSDKPTDDDLRGMAAGTEVIRQAYARMP
jgi:hypothetical protein